VVEEQRRGRAIAMSVEERDAFLAEGRVSRVGTINPDGSPHVSAVWYHWDGEIMWFYSLIKSLRWTNVLRDPRMSVMVDAGEDQYFQLRGVELRGTAEPIGELPRMGAHSPELVEPERHFGRRYLGGSMDGYDGRHGWLRFTPSKVVTWDFRKLSGTETITNPNR
jgi:PPOX class probable F420-dependent enzyme